MVLHWVVATAKHFDLLIYSERYLIVVSATAAIQMDCYTIVVNSVAVISIAYFPVFAENLWRKENLHFR